MYFIRNDDLESSKKSIITSGKETVSDIAKKYQVSVGDLINYNDIETDQLDINNNAAYLDYVTQYASYSIPNFTNVKDYLTFINLIGIPVLKSLTIYIPTKVTGDLDPVKESTKYDYSNTSITEKQSNASGGVRWVKTSHLNTDSYFWVYAGGVPSESYKLPVIPEQFSDENSPRFSAVELLGRSVAYQVYNTTGRSCSFSFKMHEEIESDYDYVHKIVARIQSACYPEYSGNVVVPPEIRFKLGDHLNIRGILTGCNVNWMLPMIDKKYTNCELSISVTETTGPYSMSEVAEMKAFRG